MAGHFACGHSSSEGAGLIRRTLRVVLGWTLVTASIAWLPMSARADAGQRLWRSLFNSPDNGGDSGVTLAVAPDGQRVFVTGQSDLRYLTIAYDATTGRKLWARRYVGPGVQDAPTAIAVGPRGHQVYVTG